MRDDQLWDQYIYIVKGSECRLEDARSFTINAHRAYERQYSGHDKK